MYQIISFLIKNLNLMAATCLKTWGKTWVQTLLHYKHKLFRYIILSKYTFLPTILFCRMKQVKSRLLKNQEGNQNKVKKKTFIMERLDSPNDHQTRPLTRCRTTDRTQCTHRLKQKTHQLLWMRWVKIQSVFMLKWRKNELYFACFGIYNKL